MSAQTRRPTYSREQIGQYFSRLQLPEPSRLYSISDIGPKAALSYLGVLQRHHLTTIPFENLSIHYSPSRHVSIHPDAVFQKIVQSKGRGGYCMELNSIFAALLRSLGYEIYSSGARVKNGNDYTGWDHMINIVTIGDSRYLVDVGFGSNFCSTQPIKLVHDTAGFENVYPASARLLWKGIAGNENQSQKLWVYQHRIGSEKEFEDQYCFTDTEFRPNDFQVMNWYTSTHPKAFFTQRVICNKMIIGEKDEIVGALLLQTGIKRRIGKESERFEEFKTEEDRVKALREHFDIELSAAEQDAIKGTCTEIQPMVE